jgi:hypothetical protein
MAVFFACVFNDVASPIDATADIKRNYSHLQMPENLEILLYRLQSEIINRAKNSAQAS